MPIYYFDVSRRGSCYPDTEGTVFANQALAQQEARDLLPDMARDWFSGGDDQTVSVTVRDNVGLSVFIADLVLSGRHPKLSD